MSKLTLFSFKIKKRPLAVGRKATARTYKMKDVNVTIKGKYVKILKDELLKEYHKLSERWLNDVTDGYMSSAYYHDIQRQALFQVLYRLDEAINEDNKAIQEIVDNGGFN